MSPGPTARGQCSGAVWPAECREETMNQTYLISLNAPPMGEGDACYAAVTVTPEVLEVVRRCRKALKDIADLPGYGHVTRRHSVPAIVFSTLPECLEHVTEAVRNCCEIFCCTGKDKE